MVEGMMKARNAKLSKKAAADALAAATTRPAEATLASARAIAPPKLDPGDMLVYKTRKSVRGPRSASRELSTEG